MKIIFTLYLTFLFFLIATNSIAQEDNANYTEQEDMFIRLVDSSTIYYSSGNYKKSMDINMIILSKAQKLNDSFYIRSGYRYLGYDYMALKDTLMAKENFEKAEKYAGLSAKDSEKAVTFMDLANFYSTFKAKGSSKKSIEYHVKGIAMLEKLKDTVNLAYAYTNAADTYIKANYLKEAYLYLNNAQKYSNLLISNEPSLDAGTELLFGQYFYKKENYFQADKHLKNAIKISEEHNLDSDLMEAYETLSESLKLQGRYEEAYANRILYEKYKAKIDKIKVKVDTDWAIAKFQVGEYRKDAKAAEIDSQLQTEIAINKGRQSYVLMAVTTCALIIVVGFIITYRRRQQLVKELKIKNIEYLEAKEETEKLAKSKSKFFSTVSHELRTPLYGVIGLSSILLEDKGLKKHEEDLKSLKFSANYLMALINDVLQINKIDANSSEEEQKEFNLRELVKTITTSFEYMRLQNKNVIKVEIEKDVPAFIKGNDTRLSQILMNLIGNACKFTENGEITIRIDSEILAKNLNTFNFNIKDTGIGIAKENQESIFEEFSQSGSANYNYQGTGLGLPIVKRLLSLENSTISLESEIGKGSSFSFDMAFEVVHTMSELKNSTLLDLDLLKDKRILVVEDNRINQIVTKKILLQNEVVCTIAENGEIAVNLVRKENFDIILMDINMPVKNGLEASKEIRTFNKEIPIIALTAVEVNEMRCEIFESGMNDIIVKPYDVTKFKQTILKNLLSPKLIEQHTNSARKAV